jgi:hypothetical protein
MISVTFLWTLLGLPGAVLVAFASLGVAVTVQHLSVLSFTLHFGNTKGEVTPSLTTVVGRCIRLERAMLIHSRRRALLFLVRITRVSFSFFLAQLYVSLACAMAIWIPAAMARLADHKPLPDVGLWYFGITIVAAMSSVHAIRYARAPSDFRLLLPRLWLAQSSIRLTRRVRAARRVHSLYQLRFSAIASLVLGSASYLFGLVNHPPRLDRAGVSELLPLIGGLILARVVANKLRAAINRLYPLPQTIVAMSKFLYGQPQYSHSEVAGVPYRHAGQRWMLLNAAHLILALGRRVDVQAPSHPVATVIMGASHYLRTYLASAESLESLDRSRVREIVKLTVAAVSGPRSDSVFTELAELVEAFENDGSPKRFLREHSLTGWTHLVRNFGNTIEIYAKPVLVFWNLVIIAIAVYLIATGKINLATIQLQR